jgi:DNA polymerase V
MFRAMSGDCDIPEPTPESLDFNRMLVENPVATFAVRVAGKTMTAAGIFPKDICVVRKDLTPVNGSIVVAIVGDDFTLKRYRHKDGRIILQAENPAFPDIDITGDEGFEV